MEALQVLQPSLSVLDAIYTRRSVRAFTADPLDAQAVRALLDAAVHAPTAMHLEPWAFVVVQDADVLRRISDRTKALLLEQLTQRPGQPDAAEAASRRCERERLLNPDFSVFYDAKTLIVICARPVGRFATADCWLAAENLMLAARAMGLGTCCIGLALAALNAAETKTELNIPPDVTAVAAIIAGVPRGTVPDVARKAPDILSWKKARGSR